MMFVGFIYDMKYTVSRTSAEALFPNILAWAEVWFMDAVAMCVCCDVGICSGIPPATYCA